MLMIELARRQKGWSQKQLGDLVRIHQSFISQIERGVGLPVPDQANRLAVALGVAPGSLLTEVPEGSPMAGTAVESRG